MLLAKPLGRALMRHALRVPGLCSPPAAYGPTYLMDPHALLPRLGPAAQEAAAADALVRCCWHCCCHAAIVAAATAGAGGAEGVHQGEGSLRLFCMQVNAMAAHNGDTSLAHARLAAFQSLNHRPPTLPPAPAPPPAPAAPLLPRLLLLLPAQAAAAAALPPVMGEWEWYLDQYSALRKSKAQQGLPSRA